MSEVTFEEAKKQIETKNSSYHNMFKLFVEAKNRGDLHPDIYAMNYKQQFWLISSFCVDRIMTTTAVQEGIDLNTDHIHRLTCIATLLPVITDNESWGIELLMESDSSDDTPLRAA